MKKLIEKRWLYNAVPVLIWFLLLVLPFLSNRGGMPADMHYRFLKNIVLNNFFLLVIFYAHTYFVYPLIRSKGIYWYLFTLVILLSSYVLFWYFFTSPYAHRNEFRPPHNQKRPDEPHGYGPPRVRPFDIYPAFAPLLAILCSFCYRIIIDNIARQELLKERENVHLQTELNFLRSQISPHFIFNVLNNLTSLARKKSDDLEPAIISLSHLMRYMLYESDDNKVPLPKEVDYLKSYISLQKLRFGSNVTVRINITGDIQSFMIEPMLLIPFVENAFKHGTGLIENPVILISLAADNEKKKLQFNVVNTVNKADESKDRASGIGLANVKRRLDILYPSRYELLITNQDNHFTVNLGLTLS
ncbi:histidine kinase [Mucilaginibacter sp. RS28]|uniref:Histidine kinase n=1 Tax=Mucilaginibacter straminoryzae TaxID=2932774 RepID=A0A9X1X2U5_9SPHI|nr:histidine kinase [Mucilaginibacter straminoryzae]MCJ8209601.1 histidine kinase [Mucilaginibacter straminoryzae]